MFEAEAATLIEFALYLTIVYLWRLVQNSEEIKQRSVHRRHRLRKAQKALPFYFVGESDREIHPFLLDGLNY